MCLKTSFSLQCAVFGNTVSEGHGLFQCIGIFLSGMIENSRTRVETGDSFSRDGSFFSDGYLLKWSLPVNSPAQSEQGN